MIRREEIIKAKDFTGSFWLAVSAARKCGVIERRLDPQTETEFVWWLA